MRREMVISASAPSLSVLLLGVLLLLLLLSLYPMSCAGMISLGSNLTASNPNLNWTSPNNTVTLGFIPIYNNPPPSFSVAITLDGIQVWQAGGVSLTVDSSAIFQLLLDGNLLLTNASGATVWESGTSDKGVTSATLDDSGNLSLINGSAHTVWSTFENPTHTILPNQTFTVSNTLRSGPYSFALLTSGNMTLAWNQNTIYWNRGLNSSFNANLSSSPKLGFQQTGILQLVDSTFSVPVDLAYSNDYGEAGDIIRFLRLDSDGNLRIYSSVRGSGTSTARWSAVENQCNVYGWCGNMGICSYNDTAPVCGCASQNFEFSDPNDSRQGCKRLVEIEDCQGSATMLELDHTQFLTFSPEISSQVYTLGISACRENCLVGGSCDASTALADGTGQCYLKSSDFISGIQSPSLTSTSFIKVCSPALPNPSPSIATTNRRNSWKLHGWLVAVAVVSSLVGLVVIEVGVWLWCCKNMTHFGGSSAQHLLLEYASGAPVQFTFKELQQATKGFREKLGAGGFGVVYRGVLVNKSIVAVKQLEGNEQGEKQFRMEIATISSTHHFNLVRLIGFCMEGSRRLLVYEFMRNGSLDKLLFSEEEASWSLLDWQTRFNIALGTARAITYLHEECPNCILHYDIKPENILLDENFSAKVSDFGLTKLISSKEKQHQTLTSVGGTRGYLAPEWLTDLPITYASDVYSYGMLLLEIVSGQRNFKVSAETCWKKLSIWAYEEYERENLENVVDKRLPHHQVVGEQVVRAIQVSFWCIQNQPSLRPTMGKVVQMLEGIIAIEKPPNPKFITQSSIDSTSITNVTF